MLLGVFYLFKSKFCGEMTKTISLQKLEAEEKAEERDVKKAVDKAGERDGEKKEEEEKEAEDKRNLLIRPVQTIEAGALLLD